MKYLTFSLLLSLTVMNAQAGVIGNCASVEHHGRDLEVKDDNKKITVTLYSDGEDTEVSAEVKDITKNGVKLKDAAAASWAIRQAIKGSKDVDQSGVVVLKGKVKNESVLVNFNTYSGGNFMVISDYVYQLNCQE